MEKNIKSNRRTLKKQLIYSFIMILVLSLVTAVVLITAFYSVYHKSYNHDTLKINNAKVLDILEYVLLQGSSIVEKEKLDELDRLTKEAGIYYDIKDADNDTMYIEETEYEGLKHGGYIRNALNELRNNLYHTPTINVPVYDNNTQKVKYVIVLLHLSNSSFIILSLVDILVPVVCFLFFTFVFTSRISRTIKIPAKELMMAVDKIKLRDLDFSIKCSNNDNELSDLAQAIEEMRSELKTSLIREWQLEQDRRDMVSSITHDIRTPLAIIQGHVEGLQDGMKNDHEKLDAYLSTIEQNVRRAKVLVDEVNVLEEVESPGFVLYACLIDLHDFLTDKTNELKILAAKKSIHIVMEVTDLRKNNTSVTIDHNRLAQVIDNLVGNSIRFTPEGGTIKMTVRIEESSAYFCITDEGPGFSEKDLSNIFKKFYKGDPSRSIEKGHSGLGLYIARTIVEKLGGEISASNLQDGGACIAFKIVFME